jgi:GntR family carbon starvation induced transcriptional regulator
MAEAFAISSELPAKSLSEEVGNRIRAAIIECKFKPGERLRLEHLCELYGVGFSPVREALSRLCGNGLVVSESQRGFKVAPISLANLKDVTATRQDLEALTLRRAIEEGDAVWEANIVASFHLLSKTPHLLPNNEGLSESWVTAHKNFHFALVSAAQSKLLRQFWFMTFDHADRYRRLAMTLGSHLRDDTTEHRNLMEAVISRDIARSCELSRQHIDTTLRLVLTTLSDTDAFGD